MQNITTTATWQQLQQHAEQTNNQQMRDLFEQDAKRFDKFTFTAADLFLDYSKNRITEDTMQLLLQLAEEVAIKDKIQQMYNGEKINTTENRAVLHIALRAPKDKAIMVDGVNVIEEVHTALANISDAVNKIRSGEWKGFSGKEITDVVNIGIGGSDLGPHMITEALTPYVTDKIDFHFVSNVDATHIYETLKTLNPETTLFIIASKTFTTQETLANALAAREWLEQKATNKNAIGQHLIAVSAKPERAIEFGIHAEHVYPFWDWVGGRYSLWSAIGLSIAIAIGMEHFQELLAGAHMMDEHFKNAPLKENMPIIMGLLGIWNTNFLNCKTQAVLPYDQYLELLPKYLQQLEMESNGKRVNKEGEPLNYSTCPVIWGSPGTNGQHAFHELIMQGTQIIPVDFIFPKQTHNPIGNQHMLLAANCLAQSQAMMQGKNEQEVIAELMEQGLSAQEAKTLAPHKVIPGNNPSNTIIIEKITPKTLGSLIALYEHKTFVEGIIWNINSFDQWGVELGKQLAKKLIPNLEGEATTNKLDASTAGLINKLI
ncbi:MAG: glucose-6-phosphate isomerase [Gammaproteobacteria bacterium]|nr:glucose-6-phosphate isomerase [Gammaproteobacteria bacterium]